MKRNSFDDYYYYYFAENFFFLAKKERMSLLGHELMQKDKEECVSQALIFQLSEQD